MIDLRGRNFLTCFCVLFFLLFTFVNSLHAVTWCVSSVHDINSALFNAQSNGEDDQIKIVRGTYNGSFLFSTTELHNLTISGGYNSDCSSRTLNPENTVIDAQNAGPCLVLTSSTSGKFEIEGLTFQNGKTTVTASGAGVRITSQNGDVDVKSNIIKGCHADLGGAVGGGLYVYRANNVLVKKNRLENNSSQSNGGGAYLYLAASVEVSSNHISGNEASSNGGGMFAAFCNDVTCEDNNVENNKASHGGGMHISLGSSGTFQSIANNIFNSNQADYDGGGLLIDTANNLLLNDNYIFGNDAGRDGGGLYTTGNCKLITALNNLVFENRSGRYGSGINFYRPEILTFCNNTLSLNSKMPLSIEESSGGGLYLTIYSDDDYAEIYNSVFWNNAADFCNDIYVDDDGNDNYQTSQVNIFNNNFDQSANGFCIPHYFELDASNLDRQDPLFIDESNGNFRPREISPSIDAGTAWVNAPATDLDGVARPVGPEYDMGAYESIYSCDNKPVKIGTSYFDTLSLGFESISEKASIYCHALEITDNPDYNKDFAVDLKGGFSCDYSHNNIWGYMTSLQGSLTISNGTMVVENLIIQ